MIINAGQIYVYLYIHLRKISNIPYNLIFTTKFNDSLILITIISCDYLNLSLANETLVTYNANLGYQV
jgi:hypothetical protein